MMNNNLMYHHSYYNYVDNVYPAEEINPLTGEIAPFPDTQISQIDRIVQRVNQSQAQNSTPPQPVSASRKRFFHYRGKILQVVAETQDVVQQQPTIASQLGYFPNMSTSGDRIFPSTSQKGSSKSGVPRKPRSERSGSYDPVARSEYVKRWKAGLSAEKKAEMKRKEREKWLRNKEKYRENAKRALLANPDRLEELKKRKSERRKIRYANLPPEERKAKIAYVVEQQQKRKERIANMSPEEYQAFLEQKRERMREQNKKQAEKQKERIANMTPEELQKYTEEQKEKRRERKQNRLAQMSEEEYQAYLEKRRIERRDYKRRKREEKRQASLSGTDTVDEPSTSAPKRRQTRQPRPRIQNVSGTQLHAMLYEFKLGHNAMVAHQNLVKAFSTNSPNFATVKEYFDKFLAGKDVLEEEKSECCAKKKGQKCCCQKKTAKSTPKKTPARRSSKKVALETDPESEEVMPTPKKRGRPKKKKNPE